jgi:hypothetical protein
VSDVIDIIDIPGRVWEDYLDPAASGMQADLGLPNPEVLRRGKGWTARYRDIDPAVAGELADYLDDRGNLLLGQGVDDPYDPVEKADRAMHRAARDAAWKIRTAKAAR